MRKADKIKSWILACIGIVFTVYGSLLCIFSNIEIGVLTVLVFGIVVLCTGIFYLKIKKLFKKRFFKVIRILLIILVLAEILLVSFIAVYGVSDNAEYNEDAVIVLGAGIRGERVTLPLKLRLDKAIEYHHKNPDAKIIVTGGQGFQETVTEAYAMEKYLLENGVDKDKIIKEEKATSTSENMKFSKEILDAEFENDYSVVIVTNNFHVFRGATIAKKTGFHKVSHIHAGLQWYNLMPCYIRESLAVMKMFVLD